MLTKKIVWNATPDARKKYHDGHTPPKTTWNCAKMNKAQEQAERAVRELREEGKKTE